MINLKINSIMNKKKTQENSYTSQKQRNDVIIKRDVVIKREFLKSREELIKNGILHYYLNTTNTDFDKNFNATIHDISVISIDSNLLEFQVIMKRYASSLHNFLRKNFQGFTILDMEVEKERKMYMDGCYLVTKYLLYIIVNTLRGRFDVDYKLENVCVEILKDDLDIRIIDKEYEINSYGRSAKSNLEVKKKSRKYQICQEDGNKYYILTLQNMINEIVFYANSILKKFFPKVYTSDFSIRTEYSDSLSFDVYIRKLLAYARQMVFMLKYSGKQILNIEGTLNNMNIEKFNRTIYNKQDFYKIMREINRIYLYDPMWKYIMLYASYVVYRHLYIDHNNKEFVYTIDGIELTYTPSMLKYIEPFHEKLKVHFNQINTRILKIIYSLREF